MRRVFISTGLSLLLGASPALATQGSVNLATPTGTVQTTSDSTATNLINIGALCGATATATLYIACANQAIINASGQLLTLDSQSGTWTVQPGNTPNTTAWLVTGTGGTFPVTQATASNLNATVVGAGSAGTATGGVVTVQGIASMTPLLANPGTAANWGVLAQGSTTSGELGQMMMGAVTTAAPTYSTTQTSPLSLDTAGNLRVNVVTGGGSGGTSAADAATWTAGTTSQTPIGCEFTSGGATAIVTAHMGTVGCTAARAALTDKSSVGGTALVAATSAYGTAPTGTAVEGVNAFITNTNPNGSAVSASSSPVVIASDQAAVPVSPTPYPATAVPITASATGTTAATTATLTNVTSHTTYICGFSIRANATAAATGNATVTGTKTATMNFTQWTAPLASGIGVTEEVFSPCIPASAVSTSIAVVSAAPGTGGVVSVSAWGYSI